MSFDPKNFSFVTADESDLSDEQLQQIRERNPVVGTRLLAQRELADRITQRNALAAYDKAYLPIRHKLGNTDKLELVLTGDDAQALLYLCELGLLAAGVHPDRGTAG